MHRDTIHTVLQVVIYKNNVLAAFKTYAECASYIVFKDLNLDDCVIREYRVMLEPRQ